MKYKLGIGVNYWDDPKGLLELLETKNFIQSIYVVYLIDGRYAGREDEEEHNTDLGYHIAKQYSNKVHYVRMYGAKQLDKRNRYWELAEKDDLDFLIVLDTDETCIFGKYFEDSLEMCMKYDSQVFPLDQDHVDVVRMARPRLFKKPFNFRHKQHTGHNISHGSLWSEYGKGKNEMINEMYKFVNDPTTPKIVPDILLTHYKTWRTKRRIDMDYKYYDANPTR